jgi:hypothetical protein
MSRLYSLRGLALAVGVAGLSNSCSVPYSDLVAPAAARGDMFNSYVAIGNSITAGYMSGGIKDSTQRRSYAFLLAQSMGTRYAYPSLAGRGCAPLIVNFQTQARNAGETAATCDLRSSATATDLLNNVAVPGAWSYDPNSSSSATSNALTTFFLGGKSQVQRAREAKPTFVSIWIGNNDLLGPAVSSGGCTTASPVCSVTLSAITSSTVFAATYGAMIDSLKIGNANLKGVLIGVVNVTNAPIMFPVTALTGATKAGFDAIACGAATSGCFGGATAIDPSCTSAPGNGALINTFLAFQIRTNPGGAFPAVVACTPGVIGPAPWVGDILVLTTAEQALITTSVTAYNAYIKAKADTLGWAYYDPNTQLAALKTAGTVVRSTPNYASPTNPFGTGMSLDGVHPFAPIHVILANDIIGQIYAKYGTTLPTVF